MIDQSTLPGWPRYLSREQAAEYVGVSARLFDEEVEAGWWPAPRRRGAKAGRCTWDRLLIDSYADRASGLALPPPASPGDVADDMLAEAEKAALRGINAKTGDRPKHRQSKAA